MRFFSLSLSHSRFLSFSSTSFLFPRVFLHPLLLITLFHSSSFSSFFLSASILFISFHCPQLLIHPLFLFFLFPFFFLLFVSPFSQSSLCSSSFHSPPTLFISLLSVPPHLHPCLSLLSFFFTLFFLSSTSCSSSSTFFLSLFTYSPFVFVFIV